MSHDPELYLAYLLRLWRVNGTEEPVWQASLESVAGGQRLGFADVDQLFDFIREQIAASPGPKDDGIYTNDTAAQTRSR